MSKTKNADPIESYVMIRRAMLKSDAYRSLGKVEMKILARIEIELMRHGGKDNGSLIATYDDFVAYGIRRMSINPGLRKLNRVGLLHVTQRGRRDAKRNPHHYRLTYLRSYDENGSKIAPTDEWRKYQEKPKKRRSAQKSGIENATGISSENDTGTGSENATERSALTGSENATAFYNLPMLPTGHRGRDRD